MLTSQYFINNDHNFIMKDIRGDYCPDPEEVTRFKIDLLLDLNDPYSVHLVKKDHTNDIMKVFGEITDKSFSDDSVEDYPCENLEQHMVTCLSKYLGDKIGDIALPHCVSFVSSKTSSIDNTEYTTFTMLIEPKTSVGGCALFDLLYKD